MATQNSNSSASRLYIAAQLTQLEELARLNGHVELFKRKFAAAQVEIDLLTGERDELVAAIKQWAKADRLERQELLFEAESQDLRSELKLLRAENKKLKRELIREQAGRAALPAPRRMRA